MADARAWLHRDAFGAAVELGAAEASAVAALLSTACDGSTVGCFSPPKGLSVECSVRPSE
jgi:hypothetical protein